MRGQLVPQARSSCCEGPVHFESGRDAEKTLPEGRALGAEWGVKVWEVGRSLAVEGFEHHKNGLKMGSLL